MKFYSNEVYRELASCDLAFFFLSDIILVGRLPCFHVALELYSRFMFVFCGVLGSSISDALTHSPYSLTMYSENAELCRVIHY